MFPGGDGFLPGGGSGPTQGGPGWGINLPPIGGGGGGSGTGSSTGSGVMNWLSLWLAPDTSQVTSLLLRFVLLILGFILIIAGLYMLKPVQQAVKTTTRVARKAAAIAAA